MKVVNSPELQNYISTVGKKLTSSPEAGEFPYTFKVVVDKSINAFALPGGPMYIHTGLLAAADNESQMVGVMAHEVSHVALRHGTNQASKQQMLQLPAMLASQATGSGGMPTRAMRSASTDESMPSCSHAPQASDTAGKPLACRWRASASRKTLPAA